MRKLLGQRGFTVIELIIVVVLVALIFWAVNHYFLDKDDSGTSRTPTLQEQAQPTVVDPESATKKVLKVTLVGLLVLGGIGWQGYLIIECDNDDGPTRVIPAAIAGATLFLGVVVVSAIEVFDERRSLAVADAFANTGKVTVLAISLLIKSYLAPITAAFALSCVVYFFLTYGELRTIPLIQGVFDWVFAGAPRWLSWTYTGAIALYSFGGAIHDSQFDL